MPGQRDPFSKYGRLAKPLPPAIGKTFIVYPAGSTLATDIQNMFPLDEDGIVRAFADTTGDGFTAAIGQCVSNRGDKIYVMPGSYTLSDGVTLNKHDVTIEGVGNPGQCVLTCSTVDSFTVTYDGVTFRGLKLVAAATLSNIVLTGADNVLIENCLFYSAVGGSGTYFIEAKTTTNTYVTIKNNRFVSWLTVAAGAVTQTGHILGSGTPAAYGWVIEDNFFSAGRASNANAGAVTDGIIFGNALDNGNMVRNNMFAEVAGATFTAGIDTATSVTASGVLMCGNNFYLATPANAIVPGSCASFANNIADGTV